jgi:hypothetical protein
MVHAVVIAHALVPCNLLLCTRARVCVCVCACSSSYDRVELWLHVECIPSTAQKSCNLLLHTCVCVCACSSSYDRVELWLLVECIPSTAQKSCNLLLHTCVCVCVPAAAATTAWTLTHGIPILAAGVATVVATVPLLMTTPLPAPPPTATTDTETGK